jgi:hypothetical protein
MEAPQEDEFRPAPGDPSMAEYYYGDVMTSAPAPHIGHYNHLCEICKKGVCTLEQFKSLVRDPKFICKQCGRVAAKAENLCEPAPL